MFHYLNYLLTLMGYERSDNNRRSLREHLNHNLDEPGTCKYCLRTIEMCAVTD